VGSVAKNGEPGYPCLLGVGLAEAGRNEVRYVPKDEVAELKKDIAEYQLFTKLAEQYADEVIRQTRRERKKKKRSEKTKS